MTDQLCAWDRQPNEPEEWFFRFQKYYLMLGLTRSIRKAYDLYVAETSPLDSAAGKGKTSNRKWVEASKKYNWAERADAYDREVFQESVAVVQEAAQKIRLNAGKAVDALIEALGNPRLSVAAANSLLDRAGVETATINLSHDLTADDLAAAEEKLAKWHTDRNPSSG
jgi:hypothetical protein